MHPLHASEEAVWVRSATTTLEQGRFRAREGTYTRKAYMLIFANAGLSPAQQENRIKDAAVRKLPYVVNSRGEKVVHEESQEKRIRKQNLKVAAVTTEAVVHRKINSLGVSHSFLLAPECILPETVRR